MTQCINCKVNSTVRLTFACEINPYLVLPIGTLCKTKLILIKSSHTIVQVHSP